MLYDRIRAASRVVPFSLSPGQSTHLVRDVENDAVVRRVEYVVEGNRQLDHAEGRAQVAARLGHVAERIPPQLMRQLL